MIASTKQRLEEEHRKETRPQYQAQGTQVHLDMENTDTQCIVPSKSKETRPQYQARGTQVQLDTETTGTQCIVPSKSKGNL